MLSCSQLISFLIEIQTDLGQFLDISLENASQLLSKFLGWYLGQLLVRFLRQCHQLQLLGQVLIKFLNGYHVQMLGQLPGQLH